MNAITPHDSLAPHPGAIAADVDRGLQIRGQIEMLEKELEQIEARLVKAGLEGDQVELVDAEREGRQFFAKGTASIVPVVFTADLLVKSFQDESAVHRNILESSGAGRAQVRLRILRNFFAPRLTWQTLIDSGKAFRASAAEILGAHAPTFISACLSRDKDGTPKSQIRVEWKRSEKISTTEALS